MSDTNDIKAINDCMDSLLDVFKEADTPPPIAMYAMCKMLSFMMREFCGDKFPEALEGYIQLIRVLYDGNGKAPSKVTLNREVH